MIKTKTIFSIVISFSMCVSSLVAKDIKWTIETDLAWPIIPTVEIGRIQVNKTLWGNWKEKHGELILGTFLRPGIKHDVVEQITEYAGSVGYRHYFNSNWHIEAKYYAGYVWTRNNLQNRRLYEPFFYLSDIPAVQLAAYQEIRKDYKGEVHFIEALVGYRFLLSESDERSVFLMPQFGVFKGLHNSDIIGPRNGKEETFVVGNLILGMSL